VTIARNFRTPSMSWIRENFTGARITGVDLCRLDKSETAAIREIWLEHQVVYNGDIRSLEDFKQVSGRFAGVSQWMIGRGFMIDPFLPQIIRTGQDRIEGRRLKLQQFHETLFHAYAERLKGPSHLLKKMKGLWRYLALSFEPFDKTLKKMKKSNKPEKYLDEVNRFFETEAKPVSHNSAEPTGSLSLIKK